MRRTVLSAFQTIEHNYADFELDIHEVTEVREILKITPVFVYASLVIEDKLVCAGLFPKKEEVSAWLEAAIHEKTLTYP